MRLDTDECFYYYVLDPILHRFKVNAYLLEVVLELGQVPLRCVLSVIFFAGFVAPIGPSVLDVVFVLLVHTVVGQVNVAFVGQFLTVSVFLGCETHQSLLEEVYFERIKARYKRIDTHVILEAVDQMRV